MKNYRTSKTLKIVSLTLVVALLWQCFSISCVYALTGGPNSPEFSSFEPVATTDMVNLTTGDFTYNLPAVEIPGTDGGGYSLSLSYHGGAGAEEEASWVGFGWTLNPGSINRALKGFPDEYSGSSVTYYNKTRPNWSASATDALGLEVFSLDISLGASRTLRFNNYQGYSKSFGFTLGIKGMVSLGITVTDGEYTFHPDINPLNIMRNVVSKLKKKKENEPGEKKVVQNEKAKESTEKQKHKFSMKDLVPKFKFGAEQNLGKKSVAALASKFSSAYGLFVSAEEVKSASLTRYDGLSYNWSDSYKVTAYLPVGVEIGNVGNFNIQANQEEVVRPAFGYLNTPSDMVTPEAMSDYYIEKDNPYNKRNYFIGIPFNNADNFMVTGEGLAGGFRAYKNQAGHYYPNKTQSTTQIRQTGIEVAFGENLGVGFDFGIGFQTLKSERWSGTSFPPGSLDDYTFTGSEYFFRFNNDLGGDFSLNTPGNSSTDAEAAILAPSGSGQYAPLIPADLNPSPVPITGSTGAGRSSYIKSDPNLTKFEITSQDGNKYIYGDDAKGKTLKSRNEMSLQVSISNPPTDNYLTESPSFESAPTSGYEVAVGEKKNDAYANVYLMSEIHSADYVDANNSLDANDGDFGGWTKFNYQKVYGVGSPGNEWYKWRTPYSGLIYSQNKISSKDDDLGSLSIGEKEISYLKSIETQTHIGCFVTNKTDWTDFGLNFSGYNPADAARMQQLLTGSQNLRLDAMGGVNDASASLVVNSTQKTQDTRYLERIVLVAKSDLVHSIKTVNFEYSYELVKNLPNSKYGAYPAVNGGATNPYHWTDFNSVGTFPTDNSGTYTALDQQISGKLTLKKLWFEYQGIANAKISPYIFKYEYFNNYSSSVQAKYPELTVPGTAPNQNPSLLFPYFIQNPDYKPHSLDMWGNHQYDGENRHKHLNPWVFQGNIPANAFFDPAAWQLKQIILPSGGAIHIQYEQKDYHNVQDRPAMSMVSLVPNGSSTLSFIINLDDLGISGDPVATAALRDEISNFYVGTEQRIYYKFLFGLKPGITGDFINNPCNSEYITGWAKVMSVVPSGTNIKIDIYPDETTNSSPSDRCLDFVRHLRGGLLDCNSDFAGDDVTVRNNARSGGNWNSTDGYKLSDIGNVFGNPIKQDAKDILHKLGSKLSNNSFQTPSSVGDYNPAFSYLRIPLVQNKKGGGIRTKALLMYSAGLDGSDELYGTIYKYETSNGVSSGVAANEPPAGKEENPLFVLLPRMKQSWLNRLVSGEDKTELEGPLGESILPGASIIYSRVISQNIHSGKTGNGFSISECYTTKDYPYDKFYISPGGNTEVAGRAVDYTDLNAPGHHEKDKMNIPNPLMSYSKKREWLTQGYRFILNGMNGQPKAKYVYGGDGSDPDADGIYLTSAQEFKYFEPGETVRMIKPDGTWDWANPGKEEDLTMESKNLHNETLDFSIEFDVSVTLSLPPPIFVSASVSFAYSEEQFSTHVINKVFRYPTLVKQVRNFTDGAWVSTENLGFDINTGSVALTKTKDGFDNLTLDNATHDGSLYSLNIPASWYYTNMGQMAHDETFNTNQLTASAAKFTSYGANACPIDLGNGSNNAWFLNPSNLVSAEVNTFKNSWSWINHPADAEYGGLATYSLALNHVFRPWANFSYRDPAPLTSNGLAGRIYSGGVFSTTTGSIPNYFPGGPPLPWLKTNEVAYYSPEGTPIEGRDIMNTPSATRYGYKHRLPTVVAKNSEFSTVYFYDYESQEDFQVLGLINNVVSAAVTAPHSGSKCFDLTNAANGSPYPLISQVNPLVLNQQLIDKGATVRLWLKSETNNIINQIPQGNLRLEINNTVVIPCRQIVQIGEWSLFEAQVNDWGGAVINSAPALNLIYNYAANEMIYIDDMRFQPADAAVTTYVYDTRSLKIIASFDDRDFGLFYQYNAEGKLIRKQAETLNGLKTLSETQYNTVTTNR